MKEGMSEGSQRMKLRKGKSQRRHKTISTHDVLGAISLHFSASKSAHLKRQLSGVKREAPGVRGKKIK